VCGYWPYELLDEGDPLTVRVRFSTQSAALRHALVWGISVEILEPPELRDALVAEARKIVARYAVT
jgi:predicted DNA-binding transcriptional regulator YafY